jgi:hypothetical protein
MAKLDSIKAGPPPEPRRKLQWFITLSHKERLAVTQVIKALIGYAEESDRHEVVAFLKGILREFFTGPARIVKPESKDEE